MKISTNPKKLLLTWLSYCVYLLEYSQCCSYDPNISQSNRSEKNSNFQRACLEGDVKTVLALLKDDEVDPGANNSRGLENACVYGRVEIIRILIVDKRSNPGANKSQGLIMACERGHTEIVRMLINDGRADPSASDSYALQAACRFGHTEIARMLVEDGHVDPSANNSNSLLLACLNGNVETVRMLLQNGRANPGSDKNYCLEKALSTNSTILVKMLLQDSRVTLSPELLGKNLSACLNNLEIKLTSAHYEVIRDKLPESFNSLLVGSCHQSESQLEAIKAQTEYLIKNPVAIDTMLCYINRENFNRLVFEEILRIRSRILSQYLNEKYPEVCQSTKDLFVKSVPIDTSLWQQAKGFKCFCNLRQVHNFMNLPVELITRICLG